MGGRSGGRPGIDYKESYKKVESALRENPRMTLRELSAKLGHTGATMSRFYNKVRGSYKYSQWFKSCINGDSGTQFKE